MIWLKKLSWDQKARENFWIFGKWEIKLKNKNPSANNFVFSNRPSKQRNHLEILNKNNKLKQKLTNL